MPKIQNLGDMVCVGYDDIFLFRKPIGGDFVLL